MAGVFAAIANMDLAALRSMAPGKLTDRDEDGRTPLIAAAAEGWVDGLAALLEMGADVKAQDAAGRTAALVAAGEGHTDVLAALLRVDKSALYSTSKSGNTALHRAAAYGHPDAVRTLLDAGASIDARNAEGATALSRACRWGHTEAASALLERGADQTIEDKAGRAPGDWAESKRHTTILELLQAAVADAEAAAQAAAASQVAAAHADIGSEGTTLANTEADTYYYEEGADGEYLDYAELGLPVRVEGWMAKQGHFFKTWKNRWFVLDGRTMWYYAKEGAAKPKGVINMVEGTDVIIEEKYAKPFCFTVITPAKRFVLQAADDDEMAEWIEAIQNNLECCAPDDEVAADMVGDDD